MKKVLRAFFTAMVMCAVMMPVSALAKVNCPNDPCHPYDPNDPCYMASACTTCYGCSLCCGHENIPYKEFDCSLCICEGEKETNDQVIEFIPTIVKPEMPKTGNPAFVLASAVIASIGIAILPKK